MTPSPDKPPEAVAQDGRLGVKRLYRNESGGGVATLHTHSPDCRAAGCVAYVLASDYDALLAQLAELRTERDAAREALKDARECIAQGCADSDEHVARIDAIITPAPANAKAKETSICAVCGEHANEHGAISHTFVGAKARSAEEGQ